MSFVLRDPNIASGYVFAGPSEQTLDLNFDASFSITVSNTFAVVNSFIAQAIVGQINFDGQQPIARIGFTDQAISASMPFVGGAPTFVAGTAGGISDVAQTGNISVVGGQPILSIGYSGQAILASIVNIGLIPTLVIGENVSSAVGEIQTYERAILTAMGVYNIPSWNKATASEQKAALAEAFFHLSRMVFTMIDGTIVKIVEMTQTEFDALPIEFIKALRLAQVIACDCILNNDPRVRGLMTESIGESSEMYRRGMGVPTTICASAIGQLSRYM